MSGLAALAAGRLYAHALSRAWPDDLDGQVRCIDEGARALGLEVCCAPRSIEAEDAAVAAELLEASDSGVFERVDAVAAALTRVPTAPPVLGLVSGPLIWSLRAQPSAGVSALDAASDLASARVRALAGCGVEQIAIVETAGGLATGIADDLVVEAHQPILRSAEHLRVELLLVAPGACDGAVAGSPSSVGYARWVSAGSCAAGLAFLPAAAFGSAEALSDCVQRRRSALACADTVLTAPLGADVDPALVRSAAAMIASLGDRGAA